MVGMHMKLSTRCNNRKVIFITLGMIAVILVIGVSCFKRLANKGFWTSPTCLPPCWNGIKPGDRMNVNEVIRILTRHPAVSEIWGNRLPAGTDIAWHWKQCLWQRTGTNSVFLVGNEVNNITLSIDFDLSVQEIVDRYGIPENTDIGQAGVPENPYVRLGLVYPTRGVTFVAAVTPWDRPNLQSTTRISEAIFYVPSDSLTAWRQANPYQHLLSWPGSGLLELPSQ